MDYEIEDYEEFVGKEEIQKIKGRIKKLKGYHIVMFNSTSNGGGVAEILNSIVVLFNKLGLKVGWRVIKGSDDYFSVTKKFHNGLQG